MSKVVVVVPTIREECIKKFLKCWKKELKNCLVIVVEDHLQKTFRLKGVRHYCHRDIEELGSSNWIISKGSSGIRTYGFLRAYWEGADIIVSLDDDCLPHTEGFIKEHTKRLNEDSISEAWFSTVNEGYVRGMPYINTQRKQETIINHGLWVNNPDKDAITSLNNLRYPKRIVLKNCVIPKGRFFPLCGMNIAFKRKALPMMFWGLQGKSWRLDRFDDIWCGVFVKKICDHLNLGIKSGMPFINHSKASNIWDNFKKEFFGYQRNEILWEEVDKIILTERDIKECFKEIAFSLNLYDSYWSKLKEAMKIWADFFK